jgi:hypothetical protein
MKKDIKAEENKDLRKFGITMAVMLFIFFGLLIPYIAGKDVPLRSNVLYGVCGAFLGLGLVFPRALKEIKFLWLKFGELLNKITSPIFLFLTYILAFAPYGIGMRIMGKDLLRRKFEKDEKSYRIASKPVKDASQLEKRF